MDFLYNRNIALVLACCLIFGFVLGQSQLLVPLYALSISNSPSVLALVVAVFPLTGALLSLASGVLSDYFGRRLSIVGGFACIVAACLVFHLTDGYYWLIIGQIFLGLGDVIFYIAAFAFLSELAIPGKQYALQGTGSGALQLGMILGPFVGGYVALYAGFRTAFLIAGVLAVLGFIIALAIQQKSERRVHGSSLFTALIEYHKAAWELLCKNTTVLWANMVHAFGTLTWPTMRGSFYLAFLATQGFSTSDAGLLISAQVLVGVLTQLGLGYLGKRAPMANIAVAAVAFSAITVGITPLLGSTPMIAVVGCISGVSAIYLPVLIGFVAENTDRTVYSTSIALINMTWAVVSPIGLFVFAVIVDRSSLSVAFLASGILSLLGVGLLWWFARRRNLGQFESQSSSY